MTRKKRWPITLAVPTFNRPDLLKKTMASVFGQTEKPDEILVIDDQSAEETWEYLKGLKGIRLLRNKKNLGSFENINQCFRLAETDYVAVVQSDDLVLPNCIKVWREKLAKMGDEPAVYFSAGYHIDADDRARGLVQPFSEDKFFLPPQTIKEFWRSYWFHLLIGGWSLYRRKLFDEIGYFSRTYGRAAENEMTLKILSHYPVYYTKEPLFAFRFHSEQGLEGQKDKAGQERGVEEAADSARALWDYEKDPAIKKSFTKEEQKERLFVRKPVFWLLLMSLNFFLIGKTQKARRGFSLFKKFYPRPYVSLITVRILWGWLIRLSQDWVRNLKVKLRFGKRGILEVI